MIQLPEEDILFIMKRINETTVVEPTKEFPFKVSKEGSGWSDDPQVGRIQAYLSVCLEAKARVRQAQTT